MALTPIAKIDLNLLTVFRAVDEARHVTRAARALGMSQSALSHALRRLRALFGDELFVKTPRGMAPTPFAESIAVAIRDVLASVERDVLERQPFRPASLERTFAIRTTDFVESLLAPALLARLATEAPGVRFAATPVGTTLPAQELESGACDLAIAGFFGELPGGFMQQKLLRDTFACAVRRHHPRIDGDSVSLDAFCAERHLLVAPSGDLAGAVDHALARKGRTRAVVAGTSGFMVAGWMVAGSDVVLTAPSKLLAMLDRHLPLRIFSPPLTLEPITIVGVWHARTDRDPAHRWFRDLVRTVLGSVK